MRIHINILLLTLLIFCSWKAKKAPKKKLNADGWSISINNSILLSSQNNYKMGQVTTITKKSLPPTGSLHAKVHFCGYDGRNITSTVIIKKNANTISVKEYSHKNSFLSLEASAPINSFIHEFNSGDTIKVYFKIHDPNESNRTFLLGQIKLK